MIVTVSPLCVPRYLFALLTYVVTQVCPDMPHSTNSRRSAYPRGFDSLFFGFIVADFLKMLVIRCALRLACNSFRPNSLAGVFFVALIISPASGPPPICPLWLLSFFTTFYFWFFVHMLSTSPPPAPHLSPWQTPPPSTSVVISCFQPCGCYFIQRSLFIFLLVTVYFSIVGGCDFFNVRCFVCILYLLVFFVISVSPPSYSFLCSRSGVSFLLLFYSLTPMFCFSCVLFIFLFF